MRPTIIHLDGDNDWSYVFEHQGGVDFASASARSQGNPRFRVFIEDEEVECVNLRVPHSWWPSSGQPFCPTLFPGETLKLVADGPVDVRLDIRDE